MDIDFLKNLVDYGVIALLVFMSFIAFWFFIERIIFYKNIDVSSYIPDSFIDNNSQKIEIYQNIALCRTEEDIQNVIDEIIDRYGHMPSELENLIEIARIKNLCRVDNVIKISQRKEKVVFYFDKAKFNPEIVDKLIKKYNTNR